MKIGTYRTTKRVNDLLLGVKTQQQAKQIVDAHYFPYEGFSNAWLTENTLPGSGLGHVIQIFTNGLDLILLISKNSWRASDTLGKQNYYRAVLATASLKSPP